MADQCKPPEVVALTVEEREILSLVHFDLDERRGYEEHRSIGRAALELTKSLLSRNSVPEIRLRYFVDPKFCTARGRKSWKQIFESNGTSEDDIFEHPHFLKFLRYFIYGPDLPVPTIEGFCKFINEVGGISGSTAYALGDYVRKQMRSGRLDRNHAPEEFFKLAIEAGFGPSSAIFIRTAAIRV